MVKALYPPGFNFVLAPPKTENSHTTLIQLPRHQDPPLQSPPNHGHHQTTVSLSPGDQHERKFRAHTLTPSPQSGILLLLLLGSSSWSLTLTLPPAEPPDSFCLVPHTTVTPRDHPQTLLRGRGLWPQAPSSAFPTITRSGNPRTWAGLL